MQIPSTIEFWDGTPEPLGTFTITGHRAIGKTGARAIRKRETLVNVSQDEAEHRRRLAWQNPNTVFTIAIIAMSFGGEA